MEPNKIRSVHRVEWSSVRSALLAVPGGIGPLVGMVGGMLGAGDDALRWLEQLQALASSGEPLTLTAETPTHVHVLELV